MKKIILTIAIAASVLTACKKEKKVEAKEAVVVAVNTADLNNVDLSNSIVTWEGSKPTGSHDGTVMLKSGGLLMENNQLKEGVFVIDMTTIKNVDMEGSDGAGNIESHLSGPDFFDVPNHPTAKFVISDVKEVDGKLSVTGNLTLRGTTKSITIPAMVSTANGITTFKSEPFNVDRTDFGVTYKSKKIDAALKDKFINDLMEISFIVKTKA